MRQKSGDGLLRGPTVISRMVGPLGPEEEAEVELRNRRCVPCEGGVPPLSRTEQQEFLQQVPGWRIGGDKLLRTFVFETFVEAIAFVQRMADVAEAEGHHPDFCVHFRKVDVSLWTFAIGGLSENDFILAAKIDEVDRLGDE